MYTREPVFLCILLLTAVMVSCSKSIDVSGAVDNPPSAEGSEKRVANDKPANTQWPPPAAQQTASQPAVAATPLPSKILTKDPEYRGLIKPPTGDDFLKLYSAEYSAKMTEVEANIAHISDAALRQKARINSWKDVDKANLEKQAVEAHATKLREYMAQHRDGWIEIGHCEYDPSTEMLRVFSIPASPFQASDKFEMHMDIATIDAVYSRFRSLAETRIADRINQDVSEYFAQEENPIYSREQVTEFLRVQRYKTYEARIRAEQMVVIGRGDLADKNIQHVSLVDYPTETVLLELDPASFLASKPSWLY